MPFHVEKQLSVLLAALAKGRSLKKATVLVYHNLSDRLDNSALQNDSVTAQAFEGQMHFLRTNGFNAISCNDFIACLQASLPFPEKTVLVTFDDGYRSNYTQALPILKRYSIPAMVFVAAGFVGTEKPFPWLWADSGDGQEENLLAMNWDELREMHKAGIEIGSHTLTHPFLPFLSDSDIEKELLESQAVIEKQLGTRPVSLALPFSFPVHHRAWPSFKKTLVNTLRKGGYSSCFTMMRGQNTPNTDPLFIKRIAIGKRDDLVSFRSKLFGGYTWTRYPQYVYQALWKDYGKVLGSA